MIVSIVVRPQMIVVGPETTRLWYDVPITASFSPVSDIFFLQNFSDCLVFKTFTVWLPAMTPRTRGCYRNDERFDVVTAEGTTNWQRYSVGDIMATSGRVWFFPQSRVHSPCSIHEQIAKQSCNVDACVFISAIWSPTLRAIPDILPNRRVSPPREWFLPRQGHRVHRVSLHGRFCASKLVPNKVNEKNRLWIHGRHFR